MPAQAPARSAAAADGDQRRLCRGQVAAHGGRLCAGRPVHRAALHVLCQALLLQRCVALEVALETSFRCAAAHVATDSLHIQAVCEQVCGRRCCTDCAGCGSARSRRTASLLARCSCCWRSSCCCSAARRASARTCICPCHVRRSTRWTRRECRTWARWTRAGDVLCGIYAQQCALS